MFHNRVKKTIENACRESLKEFRSITSVLDDNDLEYFVGGGYVLNKVLDELHGNKRTSRDIDVFIGGKSKDSYFSKIEQIEKYLRTKGFVKEHFDTEFQCSFSRSDEKKCPIINFICGSPSSPNRKWNHPVDVVSGFDIGMSQMAISSDGEIAYTDKCVSDVSNNVVSFTDFALTSQDPRNIMASLHRASKYVLQKYVPHLDETLFRLMENMIRPYEQFDENEYDLNYSEFYCIFNVSNVKRYEEHPTLDIPRPLTIIPNVYVLDDSAGSKLSQRNKGITSYEFVYSDTDQYADKKKPDIQLNNRFDSRKTELEKILNLVKVFKNKNDIVHKINSWNHEFAKETIFVPLAAAMVNSDFDVMKESERIRFGKSPRNRIASVLHFICKDLIAESLLLKKEHTENEKDYLEKYIRGSSPQIFLSSGLDTSSYENILDFTLLKEIKTFPFSAFLLAEDFISRKVNNSFCLDSYSSLKIEYDFLLKRRNEKKSPLQQLEDSVFYASNSWQRSCYNETMFVPSTIDETIWFGALYKGDTETMRRMLDHGFDFENLDEDIYPTLWTLLERTSFDSSGKIKQDHFLSTLFFLMEYFGTDTLENFTQRNPKVKLLLRTSVEKQEIFDYCKQIVETKKHMENNVIRTIDDANSKNIEECFER